MDGCFIESMIQMAEDEDRLFESLLDMEFKKAQILREREGDDKAIDAKYREAPAEDNKSDSNQSQSTALATNNTNDSESSDDDNKSANNEVKAKFLEKIGAAVKKILEAIKNFGEKIMNKIKQFIYSDNKIITKYKEALENNDNLQGFDGIKNYAEPNLNWEFDDHNIGCFMSAMKNMVDHDFTVNIQKNEEAVKAAADQLITACKSAMKEPVDVWNKDGSAKFDFNTACDKLLSGKLSKPVFNIVKQVGGLLGTFRAADAKNSYGNKIFDFSGTNAAVNTYINNARDVAKTVYGTHIKYFKNLRQALIVCGTYAYKKSQGAPVNAAADMAYMAGEASANYLDEQFAFL